METYHTLHDCGKPFCLTIDENGKQHFPDHSEVSYNIIRETFADHPHIDIVSKFIKNDMVFHSCGMEFIEKYIIDEDKAFILNLWLTSFAELYANKEMFDDSNQVSFKIKYKKLIKVIKKFELSIWVV